MRLVITGSRELEYCEPFAVADRSSESERQRAADSIMREVFAKLDAIHHSTPVTHLAHGGAPGIDRMAHAWALKRGVEVQVYKPRWMKWDAATRQSKLDKTAGFKRNWWMVFTEVGPDVAAAFDRKQGKVARQVKRIERLVSMAKRTKNYARLKPLVALREPLTDVFHPARRSVLRRVGVPVCDDLRVVAFHDGESRGTAHCILVAHVLGVQSTVYEYQRVKVETGASLGGRINHRSGELEPLGWYPTVK